MTKNTKFTPPHSNVIQTILYEIHTIRESNPVQQLNIQPIGQFQVDRPEPGSKTVGMIIVIVYQVQIRQRCKTPLEARVDPQVISLITVLDQSGPE